MINISKYTDKLNSKKEELAKIQFKLKEVGELLYETTFTGLFDRDDDHLLVCENEKLLAEDRKTELQIKILEEAIQKLKNIFDIDDEDDNESEYNSSYEETEVDVNESDEEDEENNINENIKNELELKMSMMKAEQKEPTEFKNIDEVVKEFIENNYENVINKWERNNSNNYKKSKKLLNEDIKTQTINKIMTELGYKKIKSRGKWYYENIIKKNN